MRRGAHVRARIFTLKLCVSAYINRSSITICNYYKFIVRSSGNVTRAMYKMDDKYRRTQICIGFSKNGIPFRKVLINLRIPLSHDNIWIAINMYECLWNASWKINTGGRRRKNVLGIKIYIFISRHIQYHCPKRSGLSDFRGAIV